MLIFIPGGAFDLPVRYLFAPLLSLGYISFISIMVEYWKWGWLWRGFENVGKMSLSCYLMQNILSSIIFYGWGLALGGKVGTLTIIMLWLIISLLQIVFASIWLHTYKTGPLEMVRQHTVKALMSK